MAVIKRREEASSLYDHRARPAWFNTPGTRTRVTTIYRFRSVDALLGNRQELTKQEMMMASPGLLNDPLEGHQDVYWKGDVVLWENLLRNYVTSLFFAAQLSVLSDDDSFEAEAVNVFGLRDEAPQGYRSLVDGIVRSFLEDRGYAGIAEQLASFAKPLRRKSLELVLIHIHPAALSAVMDGMQRAQLLPTLEETTAEGPSLSSVRAVLSELKAALDGETDTDSVETTSAQQVALLSHGFLLQFAKVGPRPRDLAGKKVRFLLKEFPGRYVQVIASSLIHTGWHALCFTSTCNNPAVWAAYGDQHRGVALMFQTDSGATGTPGRLALNMRTGQRGFEPTFGPRAVPLKRVDYQSRPVEVDFFRFLATLPRPQLMKDWYATPAGACSPLGDEIVRDVEQWRRELWALFDRMSTTKLAEWGHEQEIRLVLSDLFNTDGALRRVTYDVERLGGVVFGMRTPSDARLEIVQILGEKCRSKGVPMIPIYEMVFDGKEFVRVSLSIRDEELD